MAKGNIILGRLRKSVGDLTFRVADGQQIVSAKAKTVRNPKSMNQRVQRAIFATSSQLASSLYPVVNHSFEGETRTNGSLRAFRKEAIADLRKFYTDGDGSLALNPKNTVNPEPNQILVSKGRLGALDVEYFSTSGGKLKAGGNVAGMSDPSAVTFAQFKDALRIDVKGGDEIAIVTMVNRRGIISAQLNRVVLVNNISDTDVVLNSAQDGTLGFSPMVIQADKTVTNVKTQLRQYTIDASNGALEVVINSAYSSLVAAAVVVSHYDTERGMWTYTSSRMGVDANFFAAYDNDAAIASYGAAAATAPESEYFLDQSNASPSSSSSSMPGSVFAQLHSGDSVHSSIVEGAIGEDITLAWTEETAADLLSLNLTFPSTSLPQAWSIKNGDAEIAHSTANPSTSTQIGIDLEALTLPVTLKLELLYNTRGSDGSIQPITTSQTIRVPGAAVPRGVVAIDNEVQDVPELSNMSAELIANAETLQFGGKSEFLSGAGDTVRFRVDLQRYNTEDQYWEPIATAGDNVGRQPEEITIADVTFEGLSAQPTSYDTWHTAQAGDKIVFFTGRDGEDLFATINLT